MRPAIDWDHSKKVHVLVKNDELTRRLNPLLGIWRKDLSRESVRQTSGSRIVFDRIAGNLAIHERFTTGLERRHLRRIIGRNLRSIGIARTDAMRETGSRPHSGKVRFAVRCTTDRLTLRQNSRRQQRQQNHGDERFHFNRSQRGTTSSAAPAKTFRPSAKVTLPPDALLEPSFARKPSTLMTSPAFNTSRVIPRRANIPGGPPEKPHVVALPAASLTST